MTSQSSGGSGSGLPGVTTDGQTPGGEVIAGALTAGDPNAASVPSFNTVNGQLAVLDTAGNTADEDAVLYVAQSHGADAFGGAVAVQFNRSGSVAPNDFSVPIFVVNDASASTAPLIRVVKGANTQFQVDGDGVQVHGKFKTGAAVAHVLGAFSGNAVPIYDEAGTLLGYMPLYA